MKAMMSEMKNTLDWINYRLDIIEEKLINMKAEQQNFNKLKCIYKNKIVIRITELLNNFNIYIKYIQKEKKRKIEKKTG